MSNRKVQELTSYLLFWSLLFAGLILFNFRVLDSWFIVDDTACLSCAQFKIKDLLFDKATYRYFSKIFFTPLLPISFNIIWQFSHLNPIGYHVHNLVSLAFGCILFYSLIRLYASPLSSALATYLLAFSMPASFDVAWCTRIHYLWGFTASLLSIYFLKLWEQKKHPFLLLISLATAMISFLSKEAYLILPLVIAIISEGSTRDRIVKSVPYIVLFILYMIWRRYMISGLGGYPGSTSHPITSFIRLVDGLPSLAELLYGKAGIIPVILLVTLALNDIRKFLAIATLLALTISPFIFYPAVSFMLANKMLSVTAVICALFALTMDIINKKLRFSHLFFLTLFVLLLGGSIQSSIRAQTTALSLSEHYWSISQEILNKKNRSVLIVTPHAYYFSALHDVLTKLLKEDAPILRSTSSILALPYLDVKDFDVVVIAENLSLDLGWSPESIPNVRILRDKIATESLKSLVQDVISRTILKAPQVSFEKEDDRLRVLIKDIRNGTYIRCLYRKEYIGCYPIPRAYDLPMDIHGFERIDIFLIDPSGNLSRPATFWKMPPSSIP